MEIIRDILKNKKLIESAIKKNGYLAQHHYNLYLNYARENERNVYFNFDQHRGVFGYQGKDVWRILTEPIVPRKEKKDILVKAIDWMFAQDAEKIILEDFSEESRKELDVISKNKNWRLCRSSYFLIWPIVDLENWTGLGGDWKRLRNLFHKFFKDNFVEIKTADEFEAKDLRDLILKWKEQRRDSDRVHLSPYLKFAESKFSGFGITRVFAKKGNPIAISAGWPVPNTDNIYYSCIGICDYNYKNIGEAAYWDEFLALKKAGYKKIDLGGSEGGLLNFKNKFHPSSYYKTYTFSILKDK